MIVCLSYTESNTKTHEDEPENKVSEALPSELKLGYVQLYTQVYCLYSLYSPYSLYPRISVMIRKEPSKLRKCFQSFIK